MKNLKGKTALVTGASSGIGLALARELAARGVNLVITARSESKLHEIATELKKTGVNVQVITEDLSKNGAATRIFEQATEAKLTVDLLINNAGFGKWGEFLQFGREQYDEMLQVNINALTELCHLFISGMLERGDGGVINVGSTASFVPTPYAAVYSASKAYVLMFTEALHGEYGEKGLQAMAMCPGGTVSNFATVASPDTQRETGHYESAEFVAKTGLDAFLMGNTYVITGRRNKKVALLPRLLSRKKVVEIVGNTFKKTLGIT